MMDILNTIKNRRSVRKYKADMVPKEMIDAIIEAGIYAANARNLQSSIVVAVTNAELRNKISEVNREIGGWKEGFDPFYGAPVILIVLTEQACANRVYDGSLVLGNMMLEAEALGLGSCWIHRAKEEFEMPQWKEWLKSLGIQGEYEGIGHLALGYADGEYPEAPVRKENRIFFAE